jgi:hypothetical protein
VARADEHGHFRDGSYGRFLACISDVDDIMIRLSSKETGNGKVISERRKNDITFNKSFYSGRQ